MSSEAAIVFSDSMGGIEMMAAATGGKRIGYIRVSSVEQNTDRQTEALKELSIDKLFVDKASGKSTDRQQLQAALDYVRDGDVLVVCSMDRLARNMRDLQNLVGELNARNIAVEFVKEHLCFNGQDDSMSKLMLSILGGVAEFERAIIRERQAQGIAIAKGKGAYRGRRKSLTPEQAASLKERAKSEKKAALAREFGISRETLYQYLAS
jgi:DNA invertase Pin-like site-specific DNA recombinase